MDLDTLIDRYCSAWSCEDADARARLLDGVWAEGATYIDPNTRELDRDALLAHIATMQASRPGAVVRRSTAVDEHHGLLRFGFEVIGADGSRLRHGTDFAVLGEDRRRLQRVIGFFGDAPPA